VGTEKFSKNKNRKVFGHIKHTRQWEENKEKQIKSGHNTGSMEERKIKNGWLKNV